MTEQERIAAAMDLIVRFGGIDGDLNKAWVLDQVFMALCESEADYYKRVAAACDGDDGPDTYSWEVGIPP